MSEFFRDAVWRMWPCRFCNNPEKVEWKIMRHLIIIRCEVCRTASPVAHYPSILPSDLEPVK